ncbi:P-loop containing nucleoside triphosphate hydrolase protein [Rhizoctonia solani]|nr:P-loop containing nucleoside triphosphate hydrolase protein [Rhizoctonia solani]
MELSATYSWDGKVFKQDIKPIEIAFFKGLMKVDQVPIRVMTDQVKQELIERGKIYQKYAGIHHLKYDAFIGIPTTDRGIIKLPAKGRVILDTDGYSRYNLNTPGGYQPTSWNTFPTRMPLTIAYPSPQLKKTRIPHEEYKNDSPLPDEIICLTPPMHKGWSFAAKAWGNILVTNLSEITFDELAFDQLVLKPEYKKMIKALVETHSGSGDVLAKDLVSGKGGGMVMVLHGKPGTGKTLTAEAVSEHLKCPLYVVSSGELGTETSHLEKQLHDILQMTAAWKAVVLIDEADVFLEARTTFDLRRNGLVSIFLRVLEYHTGVLILTTNRIRTFDKAFVSRFSIALHYPDLDQTSRLLIWKEFLVRAGVDVGDMGAPPSTKPSYITHEELVSLAKKSFNGRVIKQMVRGAQALSIADNEPLRMSHISAVLGVTEQFEADWKELEFTENIPGTGTRQEATMYS